MRGGMDIFLVGGAVRDMLLGRPPGGARDFVFFGTDEDFLSRYPTARRAGKTFPVYIHQGREYARARGADIDEDLAARDLTINALALGVTGAQAGLVHAHPRALADLHDGVLRPCSATAMAEDPLRVFRAARFAAALPAFRPHPELLGQMREAAAKGRLAGLTAERVGAELQKACAAPRPGNFLRLLAAAGCLGSWFAELAPATDIAAGPRPWHDESVLEHTAQVMDRLAADSAGPMAVYMALCHDLGKVLTDPANWPHHYGHEKLGRQPARALGERLKLPGRWIDAGEAASGLHMKAGCYQELRPGKRVDLLHRLHGLDLAEELFALVKADGDLDFRAEAAGDLAAMLAVKLPARARNLGQASGRRLRVLRCQALARKRRG